MNSNDSNAECGRAIADQAAGWVIRKERGLTAEEQDAFSEWLAADERHRTALAEQDWSWDELDRLAGLQTSVGAVPDPRLLAPRRRGAPRWFLFGGLPMAASLIVLLTFLANRPAREPTVAPTDVSHLALCEQQQLADGSVVELNRGTQILVAFTSGERRIRLERGEAHFRVEKDPAGRPFIVEAGGVAVRAVGTAFSVSLESDAVAVLVTHGKVCVDSSERPATDTPIIEAGHRAVVTRAAAESVPIISAVTAAEIEQHLRWKPRLLDFNETLLTEIAAEFNRHNPVKLVVRDAALETLRLSGTFRSDNVEGFLHLLASDFGVSVARMEAGEIVLRTPR
jgi:transmembrane sensor